MCMQDLLGLFGSSLIGKTNYIKYCIIGLPISYMKRNENYDSNVAILPYDFNCHMP